ncbi:CoA pyrophosphatase [Rhodococcus rhodnii]|uniref:Nudix hydrolase domain-containing protein n=2 Tax=Rhodococcus rhodnii TaxID=38312 RepID=R7WIN0_9NOCA|nr:CoA pyrophosphatase [Rhodococcus rhodnii]EOM75087.1 hypothetical protein Rrhod_3585 [Rhodococcus rhodnii LMG 5362]TXG89321.1 CoA pyrophosphatase [Rhodococcus rhodnii]
MSDLPRSELHRLAADRDVPQWMRRVSTTAPVDPLGRNPVLDRRAPDAGPRRSAAVLVLFGGSPHPDPLAPGGLPHDADLLLTQRAATLREHSGQVAFPGGGTEPDDDDIVATALREANEETGVDRAGVRPLALLPSIFVPPSRFEVTPVLAYWENPSEVGVVDPGEAARVCRVSVHDLVDPRHRFQVAHPAGYRGPAFEVDGLFVWGFTAGVLAGVLAASGWELPWNTDDVRDLEGELSRAGQDLGGRVPATDTTDERQHE